MNLRLMKNNLGIRNMKKALLVAMVGALALSANAGEWAKAPVGGKHVVHDKVPVDKYPIEECVDLGGNLSVAYETDYLYKGYRFGRDTIVTDVNYTFDRLAIPVTVGVTYANVINSALVGDDLAFYAGIDLPTIAGFDASLFYTHHFYPEGGGGPGALPAAGRGFGRAVDVSGNGEIGLSLSRDVGFVVLNFDAAYNIHAPNSWNEIANNNDRGAFYYDFGVEKAVGIGAHALILEGGVAYSDNYFGNASALSTGGRSSGWSHYYMRASLPLELNCRTTLTPYVGYQGAPDGWLMDGVANFGGRQGDILHGGISLNVAF